MVNLHRLLVFFVALLCVEVAANEWSVKLTGSPSELYSVKLEMWYQHSNITFSCRFMPKLVGYSAEYTVLIPGTSAMISSNMVDRDIDFWRTRLATASSKGMDVATLGNYPTTEEVGDGGWGPALQIMVPVANFVDAWSEFETVCREWRSKLTDQFPFVREKDLEDWWGRGGTERSSPRQNL